MYFWQGKTYWTRSNPNSHEHR